MLCPARFVPLLVFCLPLACGTDAGLPPGGPGGAAEDGNPSQENSSDNDAEEPGVAAEAVGYVPFTYPSPPFGIRQGSVIENMEFLGWRQPELAQYDLATTEAVRLADFYDPTGDKGVELVLISAVAVWCGVCRTEYADMRDDGIYAELRPRGLEMLGILFEDNNGEPADYTDLVNWASSFAVEFPFVLDPAFKSGVFFDRSATPMNMIVDARTMEILVVMTGYNPEIYDYARAVLTERGR